MAVNRGYGGLETRLKLFPEMYVHVVQALQVCHSPHNLLTPELVVSLMAADKTLEAVAGLAHVTKAVLTAITKAFLELLPETPEEAQVVILHTPEQGPEAPAETQTQLVPVVAGVAGQQAHTLLNPVGFPAVLLPETVIFMVVAEMVDGLLLQEIPVTLETPATLHRLLQLTV